MRPVERLLDRLDGVRETGPGRWVACCPCHDSKSRSSLSVREGDDGRVLIHDFGGCPVEDVVAALGLDMADLFPPDLAGDGSYKLRRVNAGTKDEKWVRDNYDHRHWKRRPAPPIPARDALTVLDIESSVVLTMARRLRDCDLLTDEETADVELAMERIETVRERWEAQQ